MNTARIHIRQIGNTYNTFANGMEQMMTLSILAITFDSPNPNVAGTADYTGNLTTNGTSDPQLQRRALRRR